MAPSLLPERAIELLKHGHVLAKGGDPGRMLAEIIGKR